MVTTYIAFLRGVNVGGRNKVAMAELRLLVESLGYAAVRTFIQSGNVVFATDRSVTREQLEEALQERFGFAITVVIRTADDLVRIGGVNPFAGRDLSKVHVGFMVNQPALESTRGLETERYEPEQLVIVGTELYFYLPNGMGVAKLPAYVDRRLNAATTVRNWATVTKIAELARR